MNISNEKLDEFIKEFTPEIKKQQSGPAAIIVAWIVMAAEELKSRRAGKEPEIPVPDRYLNMMVKDNSNSKTKGASEISKIARDLKAIKRRK